MTLFPWLRLIPWILCLLLAVGVYAAWQRGDAYSAQADSAEARVTAANHNTAVANDTIRAMKQQQQLDDAQLADRAARDTRINTALSSAQKRIAALQIAALQRPATDEPDCINQPIGADLNELLHQPADPGPATGTPATVHGAGGSAAAAAGGDVGRQ
ncbi:hypothetical protein [Solimonas marina]|uniref:Uncharacterized protein n=1 Tax=Solimonas marina TaxID=2714601 RepID=A0A969W809_9GAMM|nr:hypothetical protein [Solimonas marina]NKF21599.1 hypothetical protein [Solimonas marina]